MISPESKKTPLLFPASNNAILSDIAFGLKSISIVNGFRRVSVLNIFSIG